MTSTDRTTLGLAAGLGAVAGLRSMAAPALLSRRLARARGRGRNAAARLLGSPWAVRMLPAFALGELVADKLPVTPARTEPTSLAGRVGSGALCGAAVAGWSGGPAVSAALVGAAAALGSSFLAYHLRKAAGESTGVPDPLLGLTEDALAYTAGARLAGAVT
ncbi:MAG TPA: DUF4126 family protein [Rubricoccaceae bacterium]|nr:DUF4126 family protein [Rubricoccaceae bacterium]